MELESPKVIWEGSEEDQDGVRGAADDLAFYQEGLVGQCDQVAVLLTANGQHFPLGQVHALHLHIGEMSGVRIFTLAELLRLGVGWGDGSHYVDMTIP